MLEQRPPAGGPPERRASAQRSALEAGRVVFAPSGLVAAGAGVGIGIGSGLPVGATVGLAVFGWGARLLGALGRRWWRRLPLTTIDPVAVSEPWRGFVRDALGARARFDEIVTRWPSGPIHDRLAAATAAVHGATDEVWRVARMGSSMAATDSSAPEELSRRLRYIQAHPRPVSPGSYDEEAAVAAQLQAARQRQEATARLEGHLRQLVTQLNVAVTDLATLALGADTGGAGGSGFEAMDRLSSDLGNLRQALGEVRPL